MTYYHTTKIGTPMAGAKMSVSMRWDSPADGVPVSSTSKNVKNAAGHMGVKLRAVMKTVAKGAMIPSYKCTAMFRFANRSHTFLTYALNSVSWTCASKPVPVRSTYMIFSWTAVTFIYLK